MCDVGNYGSWVADYSAQQMPCCCGNVVSGRDFSNFPDAIIGINCAESVDFWNATGILNLNGLHSQCKTQCPSCPTSGTSDNLLVLGLSIKEGVYALILVYVISFTYINL